MRWLVQVFSLELRKVLSYRVDFWVKFLGNLLTEVGVAYFLWRSVYSFTGAESIGGYRFSEMMFYYVMVPLVARAVSGPEMSFISREIYEGTLNRYLVYPISFFGYKYAAHLASAVIFLLQLVAVTGAAALVFEIGAERAGLWPMLSGMGAILAATLLYFAIASAFELVAFWADNTWSLLVMLKFVIGILGGGLLPLSLFPGWARALLEGLPFQYLYSFPIRCFMGEVSPASWLYGMGLIVVWAGVFAGIDRVIWRRGSLRYTGVGI